MKSLLITADSSSIKSCEYDIEELILVVEFRSGSKYSYADIPDEIAKGLYGAESKGKYFAANIKDKFECKKVEDTVTKVRKSRVPKDHGSDVPNAWPFPTTKSMEEKVWPFPTGDKP